MIAQFDYRKIAKVEYWRYSYGQSVDVSAAVGVLPGMTVQWAYSGITGVDSRSITADLLAPIPDNALKQADPVKGYIYVFDEDSGTTLYQIDLTVRDRAPTDEEGSTDTIPVWEALILETQNLIPSIQNDYNDSKELWNTQYLAAEDNRDTLYVAAENERYSEYNSAESARDDLYSAAESARDDLYSAAESARDDLYSAAESARDANFETLSGVGWTDETVKGNADAIADKANKIQESWTIATLQNDWTHVNNENVQYMKDEMGFTHIRGRATSGTVADGTIIFTLPAGYAPAIQTSLATISGGSKASAEITVLTTGSVKVYGVESGVTSFNLSPFATF